tara:strand:+ start:236 stop:769 length:534 start_codon:yes stop_codon:yes gene_type:complete
MPEELVLKIVVYWLERINLTLQFDCVLRFRRFGRAFAAVLWPVALCTVPVVYRNHAECFVEGVVRQALMGMNVDRYSYLVTMAYEGCTMKPPNNQCQCYYDVLTKLRPTLEKVLGNRSLSHQEQRVAANVTKAVFTYLDRFYVKRVGVKPTAELIVEAFKSQLALGIEGPDTERQRT